MTFRKDGKVDVVYSFAVDLKAAKDLGGAASVPKIKQAFKTTVRAFKPNWPKGVTGTVRYSDTVSYVGFTTSFKGATAEQLDTLSKEFGVLEDRLGNALVGDSTAVTVGDNDSTSLFGAFTVMNDGSTITVGVKPDPTPTPSTTVIPAAEAGGEPSTTSSGQPSGTAAGTADAASVPTTVPGSGSSDQTEDPLTARLLQEYPPVITIRMTFPGKVLSTDGTLKGRTVTWKPAVDQDLVLNAVANAR